MIVGIRGALVGGILTVRPHPRGKHIWLADVDVGNDDRPVQIVFGGDRRLEGSELVPVAPPGSVSIRDSCTGKRQKKIRVRRYRGEPSHGMLCSLDELGWIRDGPNEVAILRNVTLGQSLDNLPIHRRSEVAADWKRALTTGHVVMQRIALGLAATDRGLSDLTAGKTWHYLR